MKPTTRSDEVIKDQEIHAGFTIPDPPNERDLLACVHCGLCLQHCPTYRLTGLETESPRGRLFLMRSMAEGTQSVNQQFEEHIGLCLNCRNCETVCPSGVRYSVLLEATRGEIVAQGNLSRNERLVRWLAFKQIFPYPSRLNFIVGMTGLYQRMLQPFVRRTGILKYLGHIGELEGLLPNRRLREFRHVSTVSSANQVEKMARVVLPFLPDASCARDLPTFTRRRCVCLSATAGRLRSLLNKSAARHCTSTPVSATSRVTWQRRISICSCVRNGTR